MITLVVDKKNPLPHNIDISINKKKCHYSVSENKITITDHQRSGFALLTLSCSSPIEFKDIRINGNSIRSLLYLSFICDLEDRQIFQPGTIMDQSRHIWCMPLILPLSSFYTEVYNQLGNGQIGKNLFDSHNLFIPESIDIPDHFPQVLQDFFSYDARFCMVSKDRTKDYCDPTGAGRPYVAVDFGYDKQALLDEVTANRQDLEQYHVKMHQMDPNRLEFGVTKPWRKYQIIDKSDPDENAPQSEWQSRFELGEQWSVVKKTLESLPCDNILKAYFMVLPGGSFIYPHCDYNPNVKQMRSNNWMYMDLSDLRGVYFKIGEYGLVPTEHACLLNNYLHAHSVVNTTDQDRWVMGIMLQSKTKNWTDLEIDQKKIMLDKIRQAV